MKNLEFVIRDNKEKQVSEIACIGYFGNKFLDLKEVQEWKKDFDEGFKKYNVKTLLKMFNIILIMERKLTELKIVE